MDIKLSLATTTQYGLTILFSVSKCILRRLESIRISVGFKDIQQRVSVNPLPSVIGLTAFGGAFADSWRDAVHGGMHHGVGSI
jgi:hypothetical protein